MSDVGIFFFRTRLGAGSTSFTAHLYKAFELAGLKPTIYRVTESDQCGVSEFGTYDGMRYKGVSFHTARRICKSMPTIMSAITRSPHVKEGTIQELRKFGMRSVVHDSDEVVNYSWDRVFRPICIRKAIVPMLEGAVWLPQPYLRQNAANRAYDKKDIVSIARIAPQKRVPMLLEANRQLPLAKRIKFIGMENKLYVKEHLKEYADVYYPHNGELRFPMTLRGPVDALDSAFLNVDMSWFGRDGGGTQYGMLEAMDAGCVNVMHKDWFRFNGDVVPSKHVIAVDDLQDLVDKLGVAKVGDCASINANCQSLLQAHDARDLGRVYYEEILK